MNTLMKRSMQLTLAVLFIGIAITPAGAQRFKPGKLNFSKLNFSQLNSKVAKGITTRYTLRTVDISSSIRGEGKVSTYDIPNLHNQLLRFMLTNRIPGRLTDVRRALNGLSEGTLSPTLRKKLAEVDSPAYALLKWSKNPNGPQVGFRKPNVKPVQLEPIEPLLKDIPMTGTQYGNLAEVFRMTDAAFFDKEGDYFFIDPKFAQEHPSYQDVWNEVAKSNAPRSVAEYGWGTDPYSPLQEIFHSRNLAVQRALFDVPVEQRGSSSKYILLDNTTQSTAKEIKFLVGNLSEDNGLRKMIEIALDDAEENGDIAPF